MKSFHRTSKIGVSLVGLGLVLLAAACAGNSVQVVNIPVRTSNQTPQATGTTEPTSTLVLQLIPTQAGQTQAAASDTPASQPSPTSQVSLSKDVLPIFQANCSSCHGDNRQSAGLNLSSADGVMNAVNVGAIVAGSADNSRLVDDIVSGRMPRRGAPLSQQDIQTISNWINAGAPNN
jgi:mono/diheme cytochrome c family protein